MGQVYEAIDTSLDERVALKILTGVTADALERFRREVKLTRKIVHRNVARMFDLGEYGNDRFLTMELIEGAPIDRNIALSWPQLQAIAVQICDGLAAAHAVGVVHRDLKPDNILIETATGRAVITDFGIARTISSDTVTTQVGTPIGTPGYMSPEQLAGANVDARSDLFSLGIMLYELATGYRPWDGANVIAIAVAQATTPPRVFIQRVEVPAAFIDLIAACLSLDPALRPASAADLSIAIAAANRNSEPQRTWAVRKPSAPDESLGSIPLPVVQQYLRARAEMRGFWGSHVARAAELLDEAMQLAPNSAAIAGAYALACVQSWVMSASPAGAQRARAALARALPMGHGDAFLASYYYWSNQRDPLRGAADLGRAIARMPMSGLAQEFAGRLLAEVDGVAAAREHFTTAIELEPGRSAIISADLARLDGLSGAWPQADARVAALVSDQRAGIVELGHVIRARLAAWRGDVRTMMESVSMFTPQINESAARLATTLSVLHASGALDPEAWRWFLAQFEGGDQPQRQHLMTLQVLAECALALDRVDTGLDVLRAAVERGLVDRVWFAHCPLFGKLAHERGFVAMRSEVATRAEQLLAAFGR